jgi:hypothetical protein
MKIKVIHNKYPILDIDEDNQALWRVPNPDAGWSELRRTFIRTNKAAISEVELTIVLRKTLLVDLSYAYGNDSKKFIEKLEAFKLI